MGYGVRDDDLLELAAVQSFNGIATQDAVGDDRECILCTLGDENVRCFDKCTACVGHVIDQDSRLSSYVSD